MKDKSEEQIISIDHHQKCVVIINIYCVLSYNNFIDDIKYYVRDHVDGHM